jgi:hypothetical protein
MCSFHTFPLMFFGAYMVRCDVQVIIINAYFYDEAMGYKTWKNGRIMCDDDVCMNKTMIYFYGGGGR